MDDETEPDAVARGYLDHFRVEHVEHGDASAYEWALDAVHQLAWSDDPDVAWPVILALVRACGTDDERGYVAAGPVEDYLSKFDAAVIERVEVAAAADPAFRETLRGVYQMNMSYPVYLRVLRAAGATTTDEEFAAWRRQDMSGIWGWLDRRFFPRRRK
jgi:hypothetical protein